MADFFNNIVNFFSEGINSTFIIEDRWVDFLSGLGNTLLITLGAVVIGVVLGFLVAIVRSTFDMNYSGKKQKGGFTVLMKVLNAVCNVYITVIRGTPVLVQLMIMYFIVFATSHNGLMIAILSFGINSGAYVAEIMRSGIMSIDKGQFEASRSLGFNYSSTMFSVILPQAFKNVLPALGNEIIVLVKETSVAAYVGISELTYTGNFVISRTYEAFFPLISVAIIYLTLVLILTFFQKKLERRLRNSDH